jgi:uncharacterized damage-inducible protein DinB
MNKELQSIIRNIKNANSGTPWFGRAVFELIDEVDESITSIKPNAESHSCIELVYHMITWSEFVLKRIEKDEISDMAAFEKIDWREIDPQIHGWQEGKQQLKDIHDKITALLEQKDDTLLKETVDYCNYNFRFLLNGLIQHNIYHAGQIAYLSKLLGKG